MEIEEMLAFAYTECGLSIDQFFKLSWYEWSLEIEKVSKRYENDNKAWESNAVLAREIMALLYNPYRAKGSPYKSGKELLPLSFDKKDSEPVIMAPEEVEKKFPKTLNGK
jgi:hypothetical protein